MHRRPVVFCIMKSYTGSLIAYKKTFRFKDEDEFYANIPEEIYSVADKDGNFIGDILETDFWELVDNGDVINLLDLKQNSEILDFHRNSMSDYVINSQKLDALNNVLKSRVLILIEFHQSSSSK